MTESAPAAPNRVKLRKYPNRRYYDTVRSRYVTLEEIYALIREGSEIEVCDSKTGQDITSKVLAQIILELDPGKLGIFPIALLHRLIRSNEQLVNDFVERYFNQALARFMDSQKTFEQSLRQAMGMQTASGLVPEWMRRMWEPLWPMGANASGAPADRVAAGSAPASAPGSAPSTASAPVGAASAPSSAAEGDNLTQAQMRQMVADLNERIVALQTQIPAHSARKNGRRQSKARKAPQSKGAGKRRPHG